jgi:hypothetical protein
METPPPQQLERQGNLDKKKEIKIKRTHQSKGANWKSGITTKEPCFTKRLTEGRT